MGAVVTGLTLATGITRTQLLATVPHKSTSHQKKEYPLVMDTKLKIIEILQVIIIYFIKI